MTKSLSALVGVLISLMVLVNGSLSLAAGNFGGAVIIHASGLVAVLLLLLFNRRKVAFLRYIPWYYYTGGIIGIMTVVSTTISFSELGVSLTLSLGLLGQTFAALLVDHFGLFGMAKQPFAFNRLLGLLLICSGIGCMMLF